MVRPDSLEAQVDQGGRISTWLSSVGDAVMWVKSNGGVYMQKPNRLLNGFIRLA